MRSRIALQGLALATLLLSCQPTPDAGSVRSVVKDALESPGSPLVVNVDVHEVNRKLCGEPPDLQPWKLSVRSIKVVGRVEAEGTTVQVEGRCLSADELLQRDFSGALRAKLTNRSYTKRSRLRFNTTTVSAWWLTGLSIEQASTPGPMTSASAGRTSKAAAHRECPDSAADAVRTMASTNMPLFPCSLADSRVCWFGEIGCRCGPGPAMTGRWQCAPSGCPAQRPAVDAPCESALSRCLEPGGDASTRKALECRNGKWRSVTLE